MATTTGVVFKRVAELPKSGVVGAIYFVHNTTAIGSTGTSASHGDLYVCTGTSTFEQYTANVTNITLVDAGSPYTGSKLTITYKDGTTKDVSIATSEDLVQLAAALNNSIDAKINDLDVNGYAQASTVTSSGNSASFDIYGIKEGEGKIAKDETTKTSYTISGTTDVTTVSANENTITVGLDSKVTTKIDNAITDITTATSSTDNQVDVQSKTNGSSTASTEFSIKGGDNITVTQTDNVITIAGAESGVTKLTAGNGISFGDSTTEITSEGTISAKTKTDGGLGNGSDGLYVDANTAISSTNKVASMSDITTAVSGLTGSATIASNTDGVVTLKSGITETDGKIANNSDADITLAKVATTGKAEDVSVTYSGGTSETTVQGAITNIDTRLDSLEELPHFDTVISTDAASTPKGITWKDSEGTTITGTLEASNDTMQKIYLVPNNGSSGNTYAEYITVRSGSSESYTYAWEKIGDTSTDLTGYVKTITVNGKSYAVDTNSTNVTLSDLVTSVTGETAITGGNSDYVAVAASTTKTTSEGTNVVALTSTVKTQAVQTASSSADGLATALDVQGTTGVLTNLNTSAKDNLVTAINEVNTNAIKTVKVNGTALTVTSNAVDVTVATGTTDGTLAVNGTDVAVKFTPVTDAGANGIASDGKSITFNAVNQGSNGQISDGTTTTLQFNSAYNAESNKIATMSDITAASLVWDEFV